MTPAVWLTLIGAVAAPALSFLAARYAGKSSVKVKQIDIEAQAYTVAQGITNGLIENLRAELNRATTQLQALQQELKLEQGLSRHLREQVDSLEDTVRRMTDRLRAAGLEVPDSIN